MKKRGILLALVLVLLTGLGVSCVQQREPEETDHPEEAEKPEA